MFQIPKSTTQDTLDFPIQQMISTSFLHNPEGQLLCGDFSVLQNREKCRFSGSGKFCNSVFPLTLFSVSGWPRATWEMGKVLEMGKYHPSLSPKIAVIPGYVAGCLYTRDM